MSLLSTVGALNIQVESIYNALHLIDQILEPLKENNPLPQRLKTFS